MATEWYLMKTPYSQVGGYEIDSFMESLDSDLALDVELYNYDLSVCKPIRAIIQNTIQNTKLQTHARQALVPIGTCKAGMYIKYKNRFWLITGLVDDNLVYEKAVLAICNWKLTWINSKGEIVQRWANIQSASQYNNGETGMKFYFVRSDQLFVSVPNDYESMMIDTGKRMIVDNRTELYERNFSSDVKKNTENSLVVYDVTRGDTVLDSYIDSGIFGFMLTQCEQQPQDGYYVIDNVGYWLTDPPYLEPKSELVSQILCEESVLYDGMGETVFMARFNDANGNPVFNIEPQWDIECDFIDSLHISYTDNSISISVDNPKFINKSFVLFLNAENYDATSIEVKIKAFL